MIIKKYICSCWTINVAIELDVGYKKKLNVVLFEKIFFFNLVFFSLEFSCGVWRSSDCHLFPLSGQLSFIPFTCWRRSHLVCTGVTPGVYRCDLSPAPTRPLPPHCAPIEKNEAACPPTSSSTLRLPSVDAGNYYMWNEKQSLRLRILLDSSSGSLLNSSLIIIRRNPTEVNEKSAAEALN